MGRLEEIALEMQELLQEAKELWQEEETAGSKTTISAAANRKATERKKKNRRAPDSITVGDRVRVLRRDSYFGREGVVISLRGASFVNIRLAATAVKEEQVIFKMRQSLSLIEV